MISNQEKPNYQEHHPLTPDEAKNVKLSLNPFRRLGQLAQYGAAYGTVQVGMSPLPQYLTRGDLMRSARAHQHAAAMIQMITSLPPSESV